VWVFDKLMMFEGGLIEVAVQAARVLYERFFHELSASDTHQVGNAVFIRRRSGRRT
jgi:hypothetical protein